MKGKIEKRKEAKKQNKSNEMLERKDGEVRENMKVVRVSFIF